VSGACEAAKLGVDIDATGVNCGGGSGEFKCPGATPLTCKRKVQYCLIKSGGSACTEMPTLCVQKSLFDCSCPELPKTCSCQDNFDSAGAVMLKCE
jgi:hypothetical protein